MATDYGSSMMPGGMGVGAGGAPLTPAPSAPDLTLPRTNAGANASTRAALVGQFMGNSGRMYAMNAPQTAQPPLQLPGTPGTQLPGPPGFPGGVPPGALPPGLAQMAQLPPGLLQNPHASFLRAPGGVPGSALGGSPVPGTPAPPPPPFPSLAHQFTLPAYAPRG